VESTSANTASKVVVRDSSGDFSAGTITAALSGNATTATTSTNLAGGVANQIAYQSSAGATTFAAAPSASGQVLGWNGSSFSWVTNTSTATTATNLAGGAAGSLPYQSGSDTTTFLGLGTTNYVLTAGASAPQYVAQSTLSVGSATTATNIAGGIASQLVYQSGANTTGFIANGTAGQVLTSNGTSAPSWADTSAGPIGLNDIVISTSYSLPSNKNGISVGPVTINSGVTVTVGSGQRWLVV